MKVYAIRGENLTSLGEAFEIDFDAAPLRGCGLFAITGPVGAGKSTLLDALCLALFDRTPRLSESGGVLIGEVGDEARLRANDVKGVLRRGAGSGYAEVEFRGRSGRRLRARWTVRRARGKADGRFQNQAMSLVDCATDQELGGKKGETLVEIEKELGLTFEQFRRSVVLAQNEVAAFLQAKSSERAGLLERMTDTAIYGELSVEAHQRAADVRQRLKDLLRQRDEIVMLDKEARATLDAECEAADAQLAKLRRTQKALEQRDRLAKDIADGSSRAVELDQAIATKTTAEATAQASVDAVSAKIGEHDAAAEALRPELEKAREQDQQVLRLVERHDAQKAEAEASSRVLQGVRLAVQTRRPASELPEGYEDLGREFGRLLKEGKRVEGLQAQLESTKRASARATEALAKAEAAEAASLIQFQEAEAALADAPTADGLEKCSTAREAAQSTLDAVMRWRSQRLLRVELEAAIADGSAARAAHARALEQAEAASRELAAARVVLGVAEFREHLHDGEPCLLCGAGEHDASKQPPADAAAQDAVVVLTETVAERRDTVSTLRERERNAGRTQQKVQAQLDAHAGEDGDRAAVESALLAAGLVDADADSVETLGELETSMKRDVARLAEAEKAEITKLKTVQAARDQLEAKRKAWSTAKDSVRDGRTDVTQSAERVQTVIGERDASQKEEETLRVSVEDLLDARAVVVRDAEKATEALARDLATARAARQKLLGGGAVDATESRLRKERQGLEKQLEVARDGHAKAGQARVAAKTERDTLRARQAELRTALDQATAELKAAQENSGEASAEDSSLEKRLEHAAEQQKATLLRRGLDDRAREQHAELTRRVDATGEASKTRLALGELIGSADGKKFRAFAQGLSFEHLLAHANRHLAEFTGRYALARVPGEDLDLQVLDREMGDEIRSIKSLSGGETFIVSLAMALGLASMAAGSTAFETLFIDEGLGSLDPASLETVLATLDALQATGYQVGVISHVEGLAERVAARIEVQPTGVAGSSRVQVVGAGGVSPAREMMEPLS